MIQTSGVYFKNRYHSNVGPITTFHYTARMSPQLRWKLFGWTDTDFATGAQWATVLVFYYLVPYITETLQVTTPGENLLVPVWDADALDWTYGTGVSLTAYKSITGVQIFGNGQGPITGAGITRYPRAACVVTAIRTDMSYNSVTTTWQAQGGDDWYYPVPEGPTDPGNTDQLGDWFGLIGTYPTWPTGGADISDGSYLRNGPASWAIRGSGRSNVFPGGYCDFGAVAGRIDSITETANSSDASVEVSGYHDIRNYSEGVGEPSTFYGMCKAIGYEQYKGPDDAEWGPWEVYCLWEDGPEVGTPAVFAAQGEMGGMLNLYSEGVT